MFICRAHINVGVEKVLISQIDLGKLHHTFFPTIPCNEFSASSGRVGERRAQCQAFVNTSFHYTVITSV
jgi:hypothetical protein